MYTITYCDIRSRNYTGTYIYIYIHTLQTSEAVTNGVHPVTIAEALSLSALRCQEMYGDYLERKFQKGSIRSTYVSK